MSPARPVVPRLHHAGGDGHPVVLVHGFGADRLSWLANRGEIARVASVHALDLPGHGDEPAAGTAGIEAMVGAVGDAIEGAGLGPAHLVAHSLGGAVAIALAARRRDLVRSLVLIAPAGLAGRVDTGFLADFVAARAPGEVEPVLHRLVSRPRLVNRHMVARVAEKLADENYRAGLAAIAAELPAVEETFAPEIRSLSWSDVPRLVVWGGLDTIAVLDEDRLDAFGGERLILPDAAHMPHVENAREVNERIVRWIEEIV